MWAVSSKCSERLIFSRTVKRDLEKDTFQIHLKPDLKNLETRNCNQFGKKLISLQCVLHVLNQKRCFLKFAFAQFKLERGNSQIYWKKTGFFYSNSDQLAILLNYAKTNNKKLFEARIEQEITNCIFFTRTNQSQSICVRNGKINYGNLRIYYMQ